MGPIRRHLAKLSYTIGKKEIMAHMAELARLQWLSRDELLAIQQQHLYQLLDYANTYVPYYQDLFKKIGFHPADFAADPSSFQQIPTLTKGDIRQHYDRLITTEEARRSSLVPEKTGGTTGEPLAFQKDKTYWAYNTAQIYYLLAWSGWEMGDPQFWLWGHQPTITEVNSGRSAAFKNWIANRFSANAYVLTPEDMEAFARTIEQHPHGLLRSYVSTVYRFTQFLQERGHRLRLRAVVTAGEPLFEAQREFIKEVLGCTVFQHYSSVDTGKIASECEHHKGLHIVTRNCYVEVLRDNQPISDGETGEFVLTSLTNYGMPLIRYKLEDWGSKSPATCPCGRGLPLLDVVEGRKVDLFKTRDGRIIFGTFANKTMQTLGGVKQFQIVQKSLDLIVFHIVQDAPIDPKKLKDLEQYTRTTFGNMVEVQFEFVDSLPTSAVGKHRYLISELQEDIENKQRSTIT